MLQDLVVKILGLVGHLEEFDKSDKRYLWATLAISQIWIFLGWHLWYVHVVSCINIALAVFCCCCCCCIFLLQKIHCTFVAIVSKILRGILLFLKDSHIAALEMQIQQLEGEVCRKKFFWIIIDVWIMTEVNN